MKGVCKLCQLEKQLRKNSHIVPVFLLKHMIGERDEEASVAISNNDFNEFYVGRISSEKASEILIEQDEIIKPNPYARDYILCNECEKYLGVIEGECAKILEKYKGRKTAIENIEEVYQIKLLALTIIWRCSISGFSVLSLPENTVEKLRNLINKKITKESLSIFSIRAEVAIFPLSIFLRPDFFETNKTYVVVDRNITCPYYFLFAELVCIFYGKPKSTHKEPQKYYGLEKLVTRPLNTEAIKLISDNIWDSFRKSIVESQATDYYNFVGDRAKNLFEQLADKNILPPPSSDDINKFIKHLASINDGKLDRYTEKTILEEFKKYILKQFQSNSLNEQ